MTTPARTNSLLSISLLVVSFPPTVQVKVLADNPKLGSTQDGLRQGLRRFAHARYLIYYRAIWGGIEVVRVLQGTRRQETLFGL